jgi:hypothetical protein
MLTAQWPITNWAWINIQRQNVDRQSQNVTVKKQFKFKYIGIYNNNSNDGIYKGNHDNNTNNNSIIQCRIYFNDRDFGPKTSTPLIIIIMIIIIIGMCVILRSGKVCCEIFENRVLSGIFESKRRQWD